MLWSMGVSRGVSEYDGSTGVRLEYGWSTGVSTGVLESHLKYRNIIKSVGLPDQYSNRTPVLLLDSNTPKQYSRTPIIFQYSKRSSHIPKQTPYHVEARNPIRIFLTELYHSESFRTLVAFEYSSSFALACFFITRNHSFVNKTFWETQQSVISN